MKEFFALTSCFSCAGVIFSLKILLWESLFVEVRQTFTGLGLGLLLLKLSSLRVLVYYFSDNLWPLFFSRAHPHQEFPGVPSPPLPGKQDYGLHILEAGGASAVANPRVPDRLFKRQGRWKLDKAKDGYVKYNVQSLLSVLLSLGI